MRRYEKERNSTDRTTLLNRTKKIYRQLGKSQVNVEKTPSKEKVETFLTSIWGTEQDYNEEAEWLKREEKRSEGLEQKEQDEIEKDEVKETLKKAQKW